MAEEHTAENDAGLAGLAAFYEKHYSDWTVHELPLIVYVPTTRDRDRAEALALVQEILTDAAFDIRVRVIPPEVGAS